MRKNESARVSEMVFTVVRTCFERINDDRLFSSIDLSFINTLFLEIRWIDSITSLCQNFRWRPRFQNLISISDPSFWVLILNMKRQNVRVVFLKKQTNKTENGFAKNVKTAFSTKSTLCAVKSRTRLSILIARHVWTLFPRHAAGRETPERWDERVRGFETKTRRTDDVFLCHRYPNKHRRPEITIYLAGRGAVVKVEDYKGGWSTLYCLRFR